MDSSNIDIGSSSRQSRPKWSLRPLLDAIGQGDVFRIIVSIVVQALAVLTVLIGVVALVRLTWSVLSNDPSFSWGLGALLTFVFGTAALVAAAHVMWLRAGDIRKLDSAEFTVVPIAALLIRLNGEVTFVISLILGVLGMLLVWLGAGRLADGPIAPLSPAVFDNRFLQAFVTLIASAAWGFFVLLVSYLIAELLSAIFSIAINTERLARDRLKEEREGN